MADSFNIQDRGEAFVKLTDTKATTTQADAIVAGAWTKLTLNTEDSDTDGVCALASSVFTLQPGRWEIEATVPFFDTVTAQIRLRNTTDGSTTLTGGTLVSQIESGSPTARLCGTFTLSSAKAFELQAFVQDNGFVGIIGTDTSGQVEVYTQVILRRKSR